MKSNLKRLNKNYELACFLVFVLRKVRRGKQSIDGLIVTIVCVR